MARRDMVQFDVKEVEKLSNGGKYLFTVSVPQNVGWIDSMELVIDSLGYPFSHKMHHKNNDNGMVTFELEMDLETCPIYRYLFKYSVNGVCYYITSKDTKRNVEYYEKNKMSVNFHAPEWAKGATMYHIFVDRFYRGSDEIITPTERRQVHKNWNEDVVIGDNPNVKHYTPDEQVWNVDFFGGDIKGIEKKLDYIQSLGIDILYLSPVVKSQSTHRYDAADYEKIDPYAGKEEDLKRLCDMAHERGMKVILDAVFNHVGDESKYYDRHGEYRTGDRKEDGAFENPESKWRNMFRWVYEDGKWKNKFWWNIGTMPENDSGGKTWTDYICGEGGVIDKWYSLGIDGLRLDVPENLDDNGLKNINKACMRNKPDSFIVGEYWHDPMKHYPPLISSDRMHSTMNYYLTDALAYYIKYGDKERLSYSIRDMEAEFPVDTILTSMNSTSTHDISRLMTILGKKKFDTYHKFDSLSHDLQYKIFISLKEIGYTDELIKMLLAGTIELQYKDYHTLMWKLGEKGVPIETVNYLKTIFSFTPFLRKGEYTKSLPKEVEENHQLCLDYKLTPEEYEYAKKLVKEYSLFIYSWAGIACLFYGDEVGMQGLNNLANRRTYPWGMEDKDMLRTFIKFGMFRKDNQFLRTVLPEIIEFEDDHISFERVGKDNKIFVGINNTDEDKSIYIPQEYRDAKKILTLEKSNKEVLHPRGGIILKK